MTTQTLDRILYAMIALVGLLFFSGFAHAKDRAVSPQDPFYWTDSGNGNGRNGWATDYLRDGGIATRATGYRVGEVAPYRPRHPAPPAAALWRTPDGPAPANACGWGRFEVVGTGECFGTPLAPKP